MHNNTMKQQKQQHFLTNIDDILNLSQIQKLKKAKPISINKTASRGIISCRGLVSEIRAGVSLAAVVPDPV